jgi:hypothetical protein
MALLQVQGDGRGVGDHLAAVNQYRHLSLARETEQLDLAQTRNDLHQPVVETLERQYEAHLLAEGGMSELMELQGGFSESGTGESGGAAGVVIPPAAE